MPLTALRFGRAAALAAVLLALLLTLAHVGTGSAQAASGSLGSLGSSAAEPAPPSDPTPPVTPSPEQPPAPTEPVDIPLPSPMELHGMLADQNAPVTISVLGDSTSNNVGEFPDLLAQRIASQYNRPVNLHWWSITDTAYTITDLYGADLPGVPVDIWNGSGAGRGFGYATVVNHQLVPVRPDIVIINLGHNDLPGEVLTSYFTRLHDTLTTRWTNPPAIVDAIQNPRFDPAAETAQAVRDQLRTLIAGRPYDYLLDVEAAFLAQTDWQSRFITREGIHLNDAGSVLWEATLAAALGLR